MKKLFSALITLTYFSTTLYAAPSPTDSFYINKLSSPNNYFSLEIVASSPSNNYEVSGIPTNKFYIIQAINNFIQQNFLKQDKKAYVEFGYSNEQTYWFTTLPCKIPLYKNNQVVNVTIVKEGTHKACNEKLWNRV